MAQLKVYASNQAAVLLANFLDNYEIQSLTIQVTDVAEHVFGGLRSASYAPERKLLAYILYYSPLLLLNRNGRTLGQDFTALSMIQKTEPSTRNPSKQLSTLSALTKHSYMAVCALYIILPYLNERKESIYDCLKILFTDDSAGSDERATAANSTQSAVDAAPTGHVEESIFNHIYRGLLVSWQGAANANSERMEVVKRYLHDIHSFFFLLNGRYATELTHLVVFIE